MAHHMAAEMASLAGVDLDRGRPGRADTVGVGAGLLVALDHGDRKFARDLGQGAAQQGRLARPRRGHQIEHQNTGRRETIPVGGGIAGILAHNVGLKLDQPGLAHARNGNARSPMAIVQIIAMMVMMVVVVVMLMIVVMMVMPVVVVMPVLMPMIVPVMMPAFQLGFAFAASANRAHHKTSNSRMVMSSPPVTCN